jgi:hypothetical protein
MIRPFRTVSAGNGHPFLLIIHGDFPKGKGYGKNDMANLPGIALYSFSCGLRSTEDPFGAVVWKGGLKAVSETLYCRRQTL